ncbi:MAG: hypothetical protein ACKOZY_07870 [Flavobacteriales bacterium]
MKAIHLYAITSILTLYGCVQKEDDDIGPPLPPSPISTDTIIDDHTWVLTGETWVIEKYRIGSFTNPIDVHDTIQFLTNQEALYNTYPTSYSWYPSTSVYVLTLNESPWGMITGALNEYQLVTGEMLSTPFSVITPGSAQQQIHLWGRRL